MSRRHTAKARFSVMQPATGAETAAAAGLRTVLVIAPSRDLTFVEEDIRILSRQYAVDVCARRDFLTRWHLLSALIRRFSARRYALVYVWFAEPYDSPYIVLLARLFRIKTAIVVGGYDVAALPAFGYGSLTTRAGRWKVRTALLGAHGLLPTSRLLEGEIRQLGCRSGIRVIYPGVDCEYFTPGTRQKEPLVITVGAVAPTTWRVKGLDVFARCAALLPGVRFVIIGPATDAEAVAQLQAAGGANLIIVGRRLSRQELLPWLQRASVYAQLSVRESFGLALAEAMACECVPVATRAGALPEVVGDAGVLVDYGDPSAASGAIRQALDGSQRDRGARARQRVMDLFPLQRRERELADAVALILAAR